MGNTIYASFADASFAEKATGALLDFGVRAEDISVVHGNGDIKNASVEYQGTSPYPIGEQTWVGENRDIAANRIGYSGAAYDTLSLAPDTTPSASEIAYENANYGNAATRTGFDGDNVSLNEYSASEYPTDRSQESRAAMTSSQFGHDTNDYPREDRQPNNDIERAGKSGISTTTAADAGAGAIKGAGWGAGLGIVAAIASLAVPGFGIVLGAGALATAIGAALATTGAGAVAGAMTGYLKDQGMEEQVAAHYEKTVRNGGALLAVTFPSGNADEAQIHEILNKYGATAVDQASRGYVA
jgi:hypothetical protein